VAKVKEDLMSGDLIQIALQLDAGSDADALETEDQASRLRQQLLELDVQSVDRLVAGGAPPGTRGDPLTLLGCLVVTLMKSPEAVKAVTGAVQSWMAQHQTHTIELQVDGDVLKVTGPSTVEQQQLIALFVERHSH
jgi:hypothetical protein